MKLFRFTLLLTALFFIQHLSAVPAYPYPVKIKQADGSIITVVKRGDEFHHYHETEDGYLLVKNSEGIFNYGLKTATGEIVDSRVKASDAALRTGSELNFVKQLEKHVPMHTENIAMRAQRVQSEKVPVQKRAYPLEGSPRSLVILVNFADLSFQVPNAKEAFNDMLNESGYSQNGATGSARDYFIDNSMGKFNPDFDVVGPFTLPQPMSYYGKNGSDGFDENAVQMIVDACTLAHQSGVDFSDYDTDFDHIVDNIFVFYAGHNEAEWGGENTIWPHRWGVYPTSMYNGGNYTGSVASVTFNGVRIEDYACTSEFKGNSGTNMAGIATFVHEFGHVLGLPDLYATNNANHHTLDAWSVMDGGVYLNQGRTPSTYNSFERFQLNFLTPKVLKDPAIIELNPITTGNEAYLISQTESHNLQPSSPNPSEYFLLENRQKIGWDSYLPGHGMLIYRINYNHQKYLYNTVNNDRNDMGVDIIEADGIASKQTLAGDPFPGTSNKTQFFPQLRNGTRLSEQTISAITENNNIISFNYKDAGNLPLVRVTGTPEMFNTVQGTPSEPQSLIISGERLHDEINITLQPRAHYELKLAGDPEAPWSKNILVNPVDSTVGNTEVLVRYNPSVPSYLLTHVAQIILSSTYAAEAVLNLSGKSTRPVLVTTPVNTEAVDVSHTGFKAVWNEVFDATGYYITLYETDENDETTVHTDNLLIENHEYDFRHLISGRKYAFEVKATDRNLDLNYENITGSSEPVQITLDQYPDNKVLRVVVNNKTLKVFVPEPGETIHIFNIYGQRVFSTTAEDYMVDIPNLPKQMVYVVQYGKKRRAKVIL